jgi:acetylornithine deacetylase
MIDESVCSDILRAVDRQFDEQVDFLAGLVRIPSQRGHESAAQDAMASAYASLDYSVDRWEIDLESIRHLPGFSPVVAPYENAVNVVATHRARESVGRSLILNGHIDVVPTGPLSGWSRDPYDPAIIDGWMHGRGAGDMKAGLTANLYALLALRKIGAQPAANVFLQSVVEEECTGNGALACVQRGYRADAAFIPEPLEPKLMRAQVGPLWFQVQVSGDPQHASGGFNEAGANAIEKAMILIAALKRLEIVRNEQKHQHEHFKDHAHPIRFNLGKIAGGDWASSVPAWCHFDMRVAVYPGESLPTARREIEECIARAAAADPYLRNHLPKVIYNGFMAEGYVLADAPELESALRTSHERVWGEALREHSTAAASDARYFGLYQSTPTLVYGPSCRRPHGFDEAVDLESLRKVTQTMALFVAQWCRLERL